MSLEHIVILKNILLFMIPVILFIILMKSSWKESALKVSDAGNDFVGRI